MPRRNHHFISLKACSPVRVTFIIQLFELRKTFRLIRRRRFPFSTTVAICWTDVVLANLGLFSVALTSGVCPDGLTATNTNGLICQQQHNYFLAAAQLPGGSVYGCHIRLTRESEHWLHVHSMTTLHRSSPAAKKLAIRLLHAVYVLGAQLNDYDTWDALKYVRPLENMKVLSPTSRLVLIQTSLQTFACNC